MNSLFKLYRVLDKKHHITICFIFLTMLLVILFEMLGIALVLPFIGTLLGESNNSAINKVISFLNPSGDLKRDELISFSLILLVSAFFIKSILLTYFFWFLNKSNMKIVVELSTRLYEYYLKKQSYLKTISRNSAELMRNIQGSTNSSINGFLTSVLNIILEILTIIGISIILILVDPKIFFVIFIILSVLITIYYFLTRDIMKSWGVKTQEYDFERLKHLKQGLYATKEIRLMHGEQKFIDFFVDFLKKSAALTVLYRTISALPRVWIELLMVILFSFFVFIMIRNNNDYSSVISIIAVYAVTGLRLMPSVNKLVINLQTIKFSTSPVDILFKEVNEIEENIKNYDETLTDSNSINDIEKIEIKELYFSYPNNEKPTLDKINLQINKYELVGIVGESGSGKSTLINIVMGLLPPSQGEVFINGNRLLTCLKSYQKKIGYVPQDIFLSDNTIRENIALGTPDREISNEKIDQVIHQAELSEFINNLPQGKDTIVGEFGSRISGGQKQRIGIARALYNEPQVLVFDEATSSLDLKTEENIVVNVINKLKGKLTMLIISHRPSALEGCDRIIKIVDGKIVNR